VSGPRDRRTGGPPHARSDGMPRREPSPARPGLLPSQTRPAHASEAAAGEKRGPEPKPGSVLSASSSAAAVEREEVKLVELRKVHLERVLLVGVALGIHVSEADASLAELRALAETAGAQVLDELVQRRDRPDAATFVGKGKAMEVRDLARDLGADTVVIDEELAPGQLRRLEELVGIKVIDRTALILDIFAQHAHSREGKAQVELAQLNYLLPRLRGWGESLTRLGGGIGTRGPGETKMEVDRRRIKRRIAKLHRDLTGLRQTRQVKRQERTRRGVPAVALAGYTNAGKSTLLNRLTSADVLVEDKLFSTLDPTTRRLTLPGGRAVTLSDTVGFVRKLPHDLIEAFKSTLEEVALADLVLHVVDGSHPHPQAQAEAVRRVLDEIGASRVPELLCVNKVDVCDAVTLAGLHKAFPGGVFVSATRGRGMEDLLAAMDAKLPRPPARLHFLLPFNRGDLLDRVYRDGEVESVEHTDRGVCVTARVPESLAGALEPFIADRPSSERGG